MRALFLFAVSVFATACWVEPSHRESMPPYDTSPATPKPTPEQPRIAIDTGRTLHATPGGGAGLFITYATGGHWKLEWTCDTSVNRGSTCPFEIAVGTNGITGAPVATPSAALVDADSTSLRIKTTTTTTLDSVTFQTEPGAAIALSMRLRGQPYPNLEFFVSNGALSTAPTDPIELVPTEN